MSAGSNALASAYAQAVPLNSYLLRSALVAALGGLLFGFDTAVISGTTRSLTETFSLSPSLLGITVSSALWGTVVGAFGAGRTSDRFGRHPCLIALAAFYLASAVGCAFSWNWTALVCFRIIGGLAIGASSVIGPMYIAEISPAARRGRMVGLFQLNIVVGILLAYLCNFWVSWFGFGVSEWRWKLGMLAIPAAAFCVTLFGIPESPRWLIANSSMEQARAVLRRIGSPDPDTELGEIDRTVRGERGMRRERLFQASYGKPIFLAISIGMFDRFGRRRLLMTGAVGPAVCLAGVAVIFSTGKHPQLWPLAPCTEPSGLSIDRKNHRLYVGCDNKMMAVVDADSGKVLATPAIGEGVDATAFDADTGLAFASCGGDGVLTVVKEESPGKFTPENVPTQKGRAPWRSIPRRTTCSW